MKLLIQENIALAPLTTLKVGGAALFFAEAKTEKDVLEAIAFAKQNDLPLFVLGGGSNVLIADRGFDGLILKIALPGISFYQNKTDVFVNVQAGEDWDELVKICVEKNLQGFECLSGIPGNVGGTPVQNVGAYGQEVSETIVSVRCFDRQTNTFVDLLNWQCGFSYRTSIFNTTEKNRFIVLGVTFALTPGGAPKIVYKDLQNFFGKKRPTLQQTREAVLQIRAAKSMVIDERDPNSRSAGSFFKNPIVNVEKFAEIERQAKKAGIEFVPHFASGSEENVKLPAAWLIEKAGFQKGYQRGKVGLSTKHTLAIVNLGGATAKDVLALKDEIQEEVKKKFDVLLKPEPVFVNF